MNIQIVYKKYKKLDGIELNPITMAYLLKSSLLEKTFKSMNETRDFLLNELEK